ncbi:hypothetical protein [Streptomyces sp. NPDC047981]|uniref:hypothetical protein n=1 Tax=Streptomyces sp. NPDC047981 TaxID=3154610 RepID=UPI00342B894C
MTTDQNPAGTNDSAETPRCNFPGPDSWTLLSQGNFFCSRPRGHEGLHHEPGAPFEWDERD